MTSDLTRGLVTVLGWAGVPAPELEYRFHPVRRWRFDLAWPAAMVACEVEGGLYVRGRHVQGAGFEEDCAKYNEAVLLGWRVLRATPSSIDDGRALEWVERALRLTLDVAREGD